jgi:hypothetical protein
MRPTTQSSRVTGLGFPGASPHPTGIVRRSRTTKTFANLRLDTTGGQMTKATPVWKHFVEFVKGSYSIVNYLFTNLYEPANQIQRARMEIQQFDIDLQALVRRVDHYETRMTALENRMTAIENDPELGSRLQLEAMKESNKVLIKDLQRIQKGLRFSGRQN